MRVGLVVYGDLSTTSGGFLYDRKVVDHLRERGDTVSVVSLPWRSYFRGLADDVDPRIGRRLASLDVDVLVEDELCHPSLARHNRRLDDVPIVSIVHHLRSADDHRTPASWLHRLVERRYLATVDGFVFNSRAIQEGVRALVGDAFDGDAPGVLARPAGDRFDPHVDARRIHRRAHEPGPLRIVFLGNLVPRKGLHTLLSGLALLPAGTWQLTVIGDGGKAPRYAERIRRRIDRLDAGGAVIVRGALSDEAVAAALARCHVLAVPSRYEAFGIVYLEAMGFGLPALGTTAGGADETITDGEDGFLVPPGDPVAIADALRPLLSGRDRLADMGRAARARYDAHPGWEATVSRVRGFLRRMARR